MKKLLVINGTMGVGKTTICTLLNKKLSPSVWLDGDWCWYMNPWKVDEANKRMVEDNITHLLGNFLRNDNFHYVIFNWVLHKESIWKMIASKLPQLDFDIYRISLLCDDNQLRARMQADNRVSEVIEASVKNYKLFVNQNTIKIDTTSLTTDEVVDKILKLIQ